jgi:hypothetical protein
MVLDATLSATQAALLLATSVADVRGRIRAGELACVELGGTRIGWRSVATALARQHTERPDLLQASLESLLAIRAGSPPIDAATPDSHASRTSPQVGPEPTEEAASRAAERLGLLREAARGVGGGEHLSGAGFNAWAARHGVTLTAAALGGEYKGWNAAKRAAGIPSRDRRHARPVTNDELLDHLRTAALSCAGKRLTMLQFNDFCTASAIDADAYLVASRFGNWNRAKAAAGLALRGRGYQREIGPADPYGDPNRPTES